MNDKFGSNKILFIMAKRHAFEGSKLNINKFLFVVYLPPVSDISYFEVKKCSLEHCLFEKKTSYFSHWTNSDHHTGAAIAVNVAVLLEFLN
jgi:hypothetical protein